MTRNTRGAARLGVPILLLTCLVGLFIAALLPVDEDLASEFDVARNFQAQAACFYRVNYGDNLFRIGLRYGVSYVYLASVNGIPDPNLIYAGNVLAVPCVPYSNPVVFPKNCAPSQTYDVVVGDNLFRIALNHETTIGLIRSANNLYGRVLRPGMHLTVPCPGSVKYRQVPTPLPTEVPPAETVVPPAATPVTPPASSEVVISMENNQFVPNNVTIKPGTRVTWVNNESERVVHTITSGTPGSPNGLFDSGANPLQPGQSYSILFSDPGIYAYFDRLTPSITGTISVQP